MRDDLKHARERGRDVQQQQATNEGGTKNSKLQRGQVNPRSDYVCKLWNYIKYM